MKERDQLLKKLRDDELKEEREIDREKMKQALIEKMQVEKEQKEKEEEAAMVIALQKVCKIIVFAILCNNANHV